MSSTWGIKEIEHVTFDIPIDSSSFETIVRYRNPPRNCALGWVQNPSISGGGILSTPSKVWFTAAFDESSELNGLMNICDSVNDNEMDEVLDVLVNVSEIRPTTYL